MYGAHVQGEATLAAVGNADIIAAVASQRLHITSITVSVSVIAASAIVSIDDGTNIKWSWTADTAAINPHFHMWFGEKGFKWTDVNKALRLVVSGGNCTVHATATGYFRGNA